MGRNEPDFDRTVREAMESLPLQFRDYLANVTLLVEDRPTPQQRRELAGPDGDLLGLYEGTPFGEAGSEGSGTFPARITLFRRALLRAAADREDLIRLIHETVLHEVGHHFGFEDGDLESMGY